MALWFDYSKQDMLGTICCVYSSILYNYLSHNDINNDLNHYTRNVTQGKLNEKYNNKIIC